MEAHEGIGERVVELALDLGFKQARRDGVVDVEERDGILRDARADVLRQCAVDINLAGDGNAAGSQT